MKSTDKGFSDVATRFTRETFFRPHELTREQASIPAVLFNRCRLILRHCQYENVSVPIRSMHFVAVLEENEIVFVDSLNYAVRNGEGGRMILLAWKYARTKRRDSLTAPVSIELIQYAEHARKFHNRLMAELPKALTLFEKRAHQLDCEPKRKKVVAIPE